MLFEDAHLSDDEVLLAADDELPHARAAHLSRCWMCRARKQETEQAILDFVVFHQRTYRPLLRPPAGPRALLKAQLAELAAESPGWRQRTIGFPVWGQVLALLAFLFVVTASFSKWHPESPRHTASLIRFSIPEPSLTPGAVVIGNRDRLCTGQLSKNRAVPTTLQRRVFEEYGIPDAAPQAYEVDYLITPALGGSDDIHNLWPQSYSSAVWNAQAKDRLEDRLHDMVCSGNLDLSIAQHDLASDWIGAYQKYFHTDRP
jgi:hypothetical protein